MEFDAINIINYLCIIFIFFIFYLNKKINLLLLIIFSLSSITPFLMEYIYPSSSMADVYIYYFLVDHLRDFNFNYSSRVEYFTGPENPFFNQAF